MSQKTFVFIHGGPGLNSSADESSLKQGIEELGHEIFFWNEPTSFSSANFYEEILKSAAQYIKQLQKNIHVITHSFGANIIMDIYPQVKESIESVCMLSPATDLTEGDRNILKNSLDFFRRSDDTKAENLKNAISLAGDEISENKIKALLLALESGYLTDYFNSMESFQEYFGHFVEEKQFRLNDHFEIRKSWDDYKRSNKRSMKINKPTLIIFGKDEKYYSPQHEFNNIQPIIQDPIRIDFDGCSHYPHIDQKERFLSEIMSFVN